MKKKDVLRLLMVIGYTMGMGLSSYAMEQANGRPDAIDRLALNDLQKAVNQLRQTDQEYPLDKALERFAVKEGVTQFREPRHDESEDQEPPPPAKPEGVTNDEWQAIQKTHISEEGEDIWFNFVLIDLDGDGERDLVVNDYIGGTGLFSYISVLKRRGDYFLPPGVDAPPETSLKSGESVPDTVSTSVDPTYLYSINDRGANQFGTWIKLRGRVYAAYRVSYYGVDHVYLLKPFAANVRVPRLSVYYRYKITAPLLQEDYGQPSHTLALDVYRGLNQAASKVNPTKIVIHSKADRPLCPIPASVKGDDRSAYYAYGAGHYSFEIVQDIPVWLKGQCYVGQLINWFGRYTPGKGLGAMLNIRKPDSVNDSSEQSFWLYGKRRVIRVKTAVTPVEGDNGA